MKKLIIPIVIILFLLTISNAYAASTFDLTATPSQTSGLYVSDSVYLTISVTNRNSACDIECRYSVDAGGISNSISNAYLGTATPGSSMSTTHSFNLYIPDSSPLSYSVSVNCEEPETFCFGSGSKTVSGSLAFGYDGDGVCNTDHETCGNAQRDCACRYGTKCQENRCAIDDGFPCSLSNTCYSNYCVHGTCRPESAYCGDGYCDNECSSCPSDCTLSTCIGDGKCTTSLSENCGNSPKDCACGAGKYCDGAVCRDLCGNGKTDAGETCASCPTDVKCGAGLQCSPSGQCVQCITNNDCGQDTLFSPTGENYCSPDSKTAFEKETRTEYRCESSTCVQREGKTDKPMDCVALGTYCQSGKCACDEGYAACQSSKKCEKVGNLVTSSPCQCDFQCESGYCGTSEKCLEGVSADLTAKDSVLKTGESTDVTLTVNNPLDTTVEMDMVVSIGSGGMASAVLFGDQCSGNQCKITTSMPAGKQQGMGMSVTANNEGYIPLSARITYRLNGKDYEKNKDIQVQVTKCGMADCTSKTMGLVKYLTGTTIAKIGSYEISLLGLIGLILVILVLITGISITIVKSAKHSAKKRKAEPSTSKDKEEVSVPEPTTEKLEEKKCKKCGEVTSGASAFCHKCGEKVIPSAPSKHKKKELTHCPKCKEKIKEGAVFCHNCGKRVKKNG